MEDFVARFDRSRNLTADEEIGCNDLGHDIGCMCPECRPDYHEALAADGVDLATEAA